MSRLYVANTTKHNQQVFYRLDFAPDGGMDPRAAQRMNAKSEPIPKGRQKNLGGDLTMPQIEDIVRQLNVFGMVGEKEIARLPRRQVPYVFNVDKVVSEKAIRTVLAHNDGVLVQEGKTRRAAMAIAANEIAEADGFEVSIEQEEASEFGESLIAEGYAIDDAVAAQDREKKISRIDAAAAVPVVKRGRGRPPRIGAS